MYHGLTSKLLMLIMAGLMACMITVSTIVFRIPIPFTTGYIHLGDSMIFLAVMILGWKYGAAAAGIGSALADILGGFAMWAPWTLGIKAVMAVLLGIFIEKHIGGSMKVCGLTLSRILGMLVAGVWMVLGYYIAEGVMYMNFIAAAIAIPWNIIQFSTGFVIASMIAIALLKTPARRYFRYS